jgi:quinol monooxygenase YgiN
MTRSFMYLRTKPGRHEELLRLFEALGVLVVGGEQPGLLAAELLVSVDDENDHLVIGEWASPEHYERWLGGPVPGGLLERLEPLLEREPETRVYRVVEAVS